VFEFLGVREEKPMLEKDLEAKLIRHIEDFLLELGRGFMFVGSQQRITVGRRHYYVDMVFYNKNLKAYVLIDLKMTDFQPEHAGQMNAYNWRRKSRRRMIMAVDEKTSLSARTPRLGNGHSAPSPCPSLLRPLADRVRVVFGPSPTAPRA
jgi:hypothetical protein